MIKQKEKKFGHLHRTGATVLSLYKYQTWIFVDSVIDKIDAI